VHVVFGRMQCIQLLLQCTVKIVIGYDLSATALHLASALLTEALFHENSTSKFSHLSFKIQLLKVSLMNRVSVSNVLMLL
jgi:hypothetical protein